MSLSIQILFALILAVVAGLGAGTEGLPFCNAWIAPVGKIFVNLIKMMIVPVVFTSLIVGMTSLGDTKNYLLAFCRLFSFFDAVFIHILIFQNIY